MISYQCDIFEIKKRGVGQGLGSHRHVREKTDLVGDCPYPVEAESKLGSEELKYFLNNRGFRTLCKIVW